MIWIVVLVAATVLAILALVAARVRHRGPTAAVSVPELEPVAPMTAADVVPKPAPAPVGVSFGHYVGTERPGPQCPHCGAYDLERGAGAGEHAVVHCQACDNRWDAPAKGWPDVHLVLWHRTGARITGTDGANDEAMTKE